MIIEVKNLEFNYFAQKKSGIKGFKLGNVSFDIKSKKIFTIIGPNGSGKSTLLKTLIGINVPYKGKILINDKKLGEIRNNRAFPIRNDIKREFLIPHSTFIYNTFLKIAELYYKGIKDSDSAMSDFLKKSTSY